MSITGSIGTISLSGLLQLLSSEQNTGILSVKQSGMEFQIFFLDGNILSMVGGYDFLNGEWGTNDKWMSGDIFLDTSGDAKFGDIHGSTDGNINVLNTFGYDYVIDLDFSDIDNLTYDVYEIDTGGQTMIRKTLHQRLRFWKKEQLFCLKKKQENSHNVNYSLFST